MNILKSILKGLAKSSSGKGIFHIFESDKGFYVKDGKPSSGRKGRTLWYKKK